MQIREIYYKVILCTVERKEKMHKKKTLFILMLVLLSTFTVLNTAFAEGGPEQVVSAFSGTVFILSFAFVLGLGAIVIYGTSKGAVEDSKVSANRPAKKKKK